MNRKTIALCLLGSFINAAVLIAAYHTWIAGHAKPRIATLDVAEIYRLKENQFAALLTKPGASEPERVRAIELARAFGSELAQLTQSLPNECGCLVLTKAAIVGSSENIPDLTPEIKRRFGL